MRRERFALLSGEGPIESAYLFVLQRVGPFVVCELPAAFRKLKKKTLVKRRFSELTVEHRYSLQHCEGLAVASSKSPDALADLAALLTATLPAEVLNAKGQGVAEALQKWNRENPKKREMLKAFVDAVTEGAESLQPTLPDHRPAEVLPEDFYAV